MAPRLSLLQVEIARDMILSKEPLTNAEIARVAQCNERSVTNICRNLKLFGTPRAPENRVGRRKSVTPHMLQVLCDHLHKNPESYHDEMAVFLWDEFDVWVTSQHVTKFVYRKTPRLAYEDFDGTGNPMKGSRSTTLPISHILVLLNNGDGGGGGGNNNGNPDDPDSSCTEASTKTNYWVTLPSLDSNSTSCSTTSSMLAVGCDITATTTTTGECVCSSFNPDEDQGDSNGRLPSGTTTAVPTVLATTTTTNKPFTSSETTAKTSTRGSSKTSTASPPPARDSRRRLQQSRRQHHLALLEPT
ncbi:uncharacterized protein KD926_003228 [Aspergillus affinis]|uniref:uncharacterized protein n=1 Tax=Aspergillus affinis TaxID=1070780 RepID=UPI0022FE0C10|nr:uncharacterized protein KD926_003228 [Aspergillus affinis]KAI9035568.1 hypothetical protein KD926_003228 [Aspergillus affinis]